METNQPEAAAKQGKVVLLVDDEVSVLSVMSRVLAKEGYRVLSAASGELALKALGSHEGPVHAAIVDMTMPGMDGAQTATELRKRLPALPIMIASGLCDEATQRRFPEGLVTAFIQKPYDRQTIVRILRETT
jgi:CheY-like chemotaxis protein